MNKFLYYSIVVLCLLSISEAAGKKPFYFNLFVEFEGSWVTTTTKISISTGAVISESVQGMYNVSKNVIPDELVISEVNFSTKEEIRKPYQMIISASSNYTAAINRFEPGADMEIVKQFDIHFREFLAHEVFVSVGEAIHRQYASGSLEQDKAEKFEITFLPGDILKFELDNPEKDERTVIMAKKIIVQPPRSFFQKYGSYFIMGLAIIIQVGTEYLLDRSLS